MQHLIYHLSSSGDGFKNIYDFVVETSDHCFEWLDVDRRAATSLLPYIFQKGQCNL